MMTEYLDLIMKTVTALSAMGALSFSFFNRKRIKEVHLMINSRMDELLKLTKTASHAEGVIEGESKLK